MRLLTQFGKDRRSEIWWFSFVLRAVISNLYDSVKRIVKLFKKKLVFRQPGNRRENFSSDSTTRIFFRAVSSGIANCTRIDKSRLRYLVSANIDEAVRKIKNTPMLAKQMVSVPEVTGTAMQNAACIFGTRRVLAWRIRTLITVHASMHHTCNTITYARVSHSRVRSSGYFAEARCGVRIA